MEVFLEVKEIRLSLFIGGGGWFAGDKIFSIFSTVENIFLG